MTDKKIQEIRERSEKDSISMKGCAWAFKDRAELLEELDAKDTIIAEGREMAKMVEDIFGRAANVCLICKSTDFRLDGHFSDCELGAWLEKVQDE